MRKGGRADARGGTSGAGGALRVCPRGAHVPTAGWAPPAGLSSVVLPYKSHGACMTLCVWLLVACRCCLACCGRGCGEASGVSAPQLTAGDNNSSTSEQQAVVRAGSKPYTLHLLAHTRWVTHLCRLTGVALRVSLNATDSNLKPNRASHAFQGARCSKLKRSMCCCTRGPKPHTKAQPSPLVCLVG